VWRAAGVQVVGDSLVRLQGFLPAVARDALQSAIDHLGPPAEVVNAAVDLLHPLAADVRRQREVSIGLLGLLEFLGRVAFATIRRGSRIVGHGVASG
jgi:hypothetical protein